MRAEIVLLSCLRFANFAAVAAVCPDQAYPLPELRNTLERAGYPLSN